MSHPSYFGMLLSTLSLIAIAVGTTVDFDSLTLQPNDMKIDDAEFYKAPNVAIDDQRSPSWLKAFEDETDPKLHQPNANGQLTVTNADGTSTTVITRDGKKVGR